MNWLRCSVVAASVGLVTAAPVLALSTLPMAVAVLPAEPPQVTQENAISGTMDIEFGTRMNLDATGDLKPGSPALGAKDTYRLTLNVINAAEYSGEITRQPNLYSSVLARRKQDALLTYSIDLGVFNPRDIKQKRVVGKWVGTVPIDTATGAYDLAGGRAKESPLRIAVDAVGSAKSFTDYFAGRMIGKAEKKESLAAYTFKRVVGNRTVEVKVTKTDPMRFENMALAMGPVEAYPRSVVNGRLDYDYETGNWYTDGIRFRYTLDGVDYEDIVTGSIKWVEDPDRETNGKGYYDFNLRFNEEKNRSATNEGAAFDKMSEEDAFFAVDNLIPALTGRISYIDTMTTTDAPPTASKVTFALNANKLTKPQLMNFLKLWLVAAGPTNDE